MPTLPTLEEALDVRRRETPGAPSLDLDACRTDRERAIEVVRWVDAVLERRLWTEDELRRRLLARTPREILAEGHICFATPCFDLTSVTAEVLRSQGFRCTVVLCRMKRFLQPVALQDRKSVV